jgi:hypothetical protein
MVKRVAVVVEEWQNGELKQMLISYFKRSDAASTATVKDIRQIGVDLPKTTPN